jgi:3',5'-cyclic AMP phosphodiesterase CpdA
MPENRPYSPTPLDQTKQTVLIAHLSDLHMAYLENVRLHDIINKRILGYVRWMLGRRTRHDSSIADILKEDLQRSKPDHMIITGDLTHLGLPYEFIRVRKWLESMEQPEKICVVPGNHDTYIYEPWDISFKNWLGFMVPSRQNTHSGNARGLDDIFPTLRITGHTALIGISTAEPSALHLATGRIGSLQLERLEAILKQLRGQRLFRVIFLHHPPVAGIVRQRKHLVDTDGFLQLIARHGCELILHGHAHRAVQSTVAAPAGEVPVLGAPSVTSTEQTPERRSSWYLLEIRKETAGDTDFSLRIRTRIFANKKRRFIWGEKEIIKKYRKTNH